MYCSALMDCVGCEKCRLWGKLQVLGLGTALKILFSVDGQANLGQNVSTFPKTDFKLESQLSFECLIAFISPLKEICLLDIWSENLQESLLFSNSQYWRLAHLDFMTKPLILMEFI